MENLLATSSITAANWLAAGLALVLGLLAGTLINRLWAGANLKLGRFRLPLRWLAGTISFLTTAIVVALSFSLGLTGLAQAIIGLTAGLSHDSPIVGGAFVLGGIAAIMLGVGGRYDIDS